MPGHYPKESVQNLEQGESLKSRIVILARLKYELSDDGHRPKHVAAF
jgi:hypothetical protein